MSSLVICEIDDEGGSLTIDEVLHQHSYEWTQHTYVVSLSVHFYSPSLSPSVTKEIYSYKISFVTMVETNEILYCSMLQPSIGFPLSCQGDSNKDSVTLSCLLLVLMIFLLQLYLQHFKLIFNQACWII